MHPLSVPNQVTITDQVEAMASQSAPHIERFAVTKQFLVAILEALKRPRAAQPCPNCGEHPAYQIPVERDTPAYSALRQASIDRMHDLAAATRGVL